jgi:methyl-accepting chemotaxis protein
MSEAISLKKRILKGYLLPIGLLVLVSVVIIVNARALQRTTESVKHAQEVVIAATEMMVNFQVGIISVAEFVITGNDKHRRQLREARAAYSDNRTQLDALVNDSGQRALLQKIDAARAALLEQNDRIVAMVEAKRPADAMRAIRAGRAEALGEELGRTLDDFVRGERKLLAQRVEQQTDELQQMVYLVIAGTGLAIAMALAIGSVVAGRISASVSESIVGMSSSTAQIAATVDEHERSVTQQAAAVNETTSTVEELGASSRQSADQAESTAASARQALNVAQEGSRLAVQVAEHMTVMQKKVDSVAERIQSLSEQAGQIGGIAVVVGELAGETNMLALNAAVEAARAGEHGKGFAVVASEIRKLAEQSKKSAERTNLLVAEIQRAVNSAVMVTEDSSRTAVEAGTITRQTVDSFNQIATVASSVSVSTQQVLLNSRQQAIALNQVTEAMKSLSAGSLQIAAGTQQTQSGVQKLNEIAISLKSLV